MKKTREERATKGADNKMDGWEKEEKEKETKK